MARGRKLETLNDFKRALKGKFGLGEGKNYLPWLRVQDVKSRGTRSQIWGRKTNREHHTLSSIESEFFYLAEFCDSVVDIREQFPLFPLNVSQKIASIIDVEHPKLPSSDTPNIITTDFVLTRIVDGDVIYEAVSVKPEDDSDKLRVLEKIDIERVWWELLGVKFHYFIGNDITRVQSRNISWATAPYRSTSAPFSQTLIVKALDMVSFGKLFISELCNDFIRILDIEPSEALNLLRFMIAEKYVVVDMTHLLEESSIINVLDKRYQLKQVSNEYS